MPREHSQRVGVGSLRRHEDIGEPADDGRAGLQLLRLPAGGAESYSFVMMVSA